METQDTQANQAQKPFEIFTSRLFPGWLAETGASLALSTYQGGMVLFFGIDQDNKLWIFNRHLERPMGMIANRKELAVASLYQIYRFVNGRAGTPEEDLDPVYVPQISYFTGDLDVHDLGFDADGELVFVNTLFGCIATVSETHSFKPLWKPKFLSRLAAEDRCHLNGLAMRDGRPAFASLVGQTDVTDGWRDHRVSGGQVWDIASNEVAASGLSMPHSPRWHDGRLWLLNAGTGEFGTVDLDAGKFEPIAFCPGYLRGLTFIGPYAVVGLSEPRENRTFAGLPLQDRLDKEGVKPRCGLYVIDTRSGDTLHWLTISGVIGELYDVSVIPNSRQPGMIGFKSDEIRRVISVEPNNL